MESTVVSAVSLLAKRILLSVAGLLMCGACADYPDGAFVTRERFGWIFTNFTVDMSSFDLSEDSAHEYRFNRVSFHRGKAIVYFLLQLPSSVEFETLDTVVTIEIWEVGDEDSLAYRHSGPLNGILSEDKETRRTAWDLAYSGLGYGAARSHLGGKEFFVADGLAELSSWKEYRMKVVVAHPEVNNALSEASAFVRLSSTTK